MSRRSSLSLMSRSSASACIGGNPRHLNKSDKSSCSPVALLDSRATCCDPDCSQPLRSETKMLLRALAPLFGYFLYLCLFSVAALRIDSSRLVPWSLRNELHLASLANSFWRTPSTSPCSGTNTLPPIFQWQNHKGRDRRTMRPDICCHRVH